MELRLQGHGAAGARREPFLQRPRPTLEFDQAAGEPLGAVAEPLQAAAQPTGGARELPHSRFEPAPAGHQPVEAGVDRAGYFAQAPHFVAGRGGGPGEHPGFVRGGPQGRIGRRRPFEPVGEPAGAGQLATADLRQQRAQPEGQGQAADRRLALAVGERFPCRSAAVRSPASRFRHVCAARSSSVAIRPAPVAARREPSARSPLPAAPSSMPPRSRFTARAARRSPGPSFSICSIPRRPRAARFLPSRRSGSVFFAIGAGPITARMPGSRRSAAASPPAAAGDRGW